jgi:predicted lipoprotein with Yx(FWY)xxD motif
MNRCFPRAGLAGFVLAAALAGGCALIAPPPASVSNGILVGPNGMTLYTFDRDTAGSGKSVCNGPCASNWPPLFASDPAPARGDWSVITRDDGTKQWAWKGKPVYYWVRDQKPGDQTGEGFNNVWRTAKP